MLGRRSLLAAASLMPFGGAGAEPALLRLWPGAPPGGGGPSGALVVDGRGAVRSVVVPTLEVVTPTRPNGAAMLIAAGGGDKRIEMATEAQPAASWLAARGITAFVLTYRLPTEGWGAGPLAPLQDAQRALRIVRSRMQRGRVGVLGFSAGGHLLGLAAVRSDFASYAPIDGIDASSDRPDAAALIYPVVTLEAPYDHTSTKRSLIGAHPDPATAAAWSVQTSVRPGDPPMFLVQAEDDRVSDPANTALLAEACLHAGVPVERHLLPRGGHGFGMGRPGSPSAEWPVWFQAWLQREGLA